ncbi:MAG: DNA double-strand break repair nuclease NurA [Methanosphaera stadtmanae]|nr:DNA double-strand break repair nuclease NurA [Methanosphaera stadtmanae]
MLEALYYKTIDRREQLQNYFKNIKREIIAEEIEKKYNQYDYKQEKQSKIFASVDGSFNKKKYMACFIYALSSQTIISKPNEGIIKESAAAEINQISTIQAGNIDRILSRYMDILELKSTIDTLKKHPEIDYMLLDGSIGGKLSNLRLDNRKIEQYINLLIGLSRTITSENLEKDEINLSIDAITKKDEIINKIKKENPLNTLNIDKLENSLINYYSGLEELTCIAYLLENYKEKIICVSKTSSTTKLYNKKIPDAALLEYYSKKTFYTDATPEEHGPIRLFYQNDIRQKIPVKFPILDNELRKLNYTTTFTRFKYNKNVIKIELPYKVDNNKLKEILNELNTSNIEGYPYILEKAHDEVVIKQKDMDTIINRIEINEKTGRDML